MRPSIWTDAFVELSPEESVRRIAAEGWRTLEFADKHWRDLDARDNPEAEFAKMRGLFEELGVDVPQMHGPMFNCCGEPEQVRAGTEVALRAINWAAILGVKTFVFHPGSGADIELEANLRRTREQNAETVGTLAEAGRKLGVKIALENLMDGLGGHGRYFGAAPEELLRVVRDTDPDWVGICWDTGHAQIQRLDQPECLRAIGPHLLGTHIADNDGSGDQHLLPFEGKVDWAGVLTALREIGYEGPFNLEVGGALHPIPLAVRGAKVRYARELTEAMVAGQVP